jgi:integrase/recombinase XerD
MVRPVDPVRRCVRLEDWPPGDQACWARATAPGTGLDDPGGACHWRPASQRMVISGYGRWLGWLRRQDLLIAAEHPAERVQPARLRRYIEALGGLMAPVSRASRIHALAMALRVMQPDQDLRWVATIAHRLMARAVPVRSKRRRLQSSATLFALGVRMMAAAEEEGTSARMDWRACRFRDGLIIAFLAVRPIRKATLLRMEIGRHLVVAPDAARFRFTADEVKEKRPDERALPALVEPVQRYLRHWRPRLLGGRADSHVWISTRGRQLSGDRLHSMIRDVTQAAFGVPMSAHLFRDAAVTTLALAAPAEIGVAKALLNHASPELMHRHYNQAQGADAGRRHAQAMTALRTRLRRAAVKQ